MKGNNKYDYREIDHLPKGAKNVADFALEMNWNSTSTVYYHAKLVQSGKKTWQDIGFEIVKHKGFNFVLS